MKRRLEAKETVCDTETEQVQDGKKSKQTLIGAIEQIVNLAVELKLGDTFQEKVRPALAYVAERMSLNEEQALVFALFIEKAQTTISKSATSPSWWGAVQCVLFR